MVILANVISIVSCAIMVLTGFIKNRIKILLAQCVQFILMAISHYLLGGTGGIVACLVSLARNLVFAKFKTSVPLKLLFMAITIGLSLNTFTLNPITWFPVIATVSFTWVIDSEDIIKFKTVMAVTLCLWFVYDAVHLNFVSAAFDAFTVGSTVYSMYQIKKSGKAEEN